MSSLLEKMPRGGEAYDPYFRPEDWSRLQYGRILWKNPTMQARLIAHWTDARHPYSRRFVEVYRPMVERLLQSTDDKKIDAELRLSGHSLRAIMREIPPVFGSFF